MDVVPATLSMDLFDESFPDAAPFDINGIFEPLDADLTDIHSSKKHGSSSTDDEGPEPKKSRGHRKGGLECAQNPGRNAQIARMNRERKKAYVAELEGTIQKLEKSMAELKESNQRLTAQLSAANGSIDYLKMCLQHESTLGKFISSLEGVVSTSGNAPQNMAATSAANKKISPSEVVGTVPHKRGNASTRNSANGSGPGVGLVVGTSVIPLTINVHLN